MKVPRQSILISCGDHQCNRVNKISRAIIDNDYFRNLPTWLIKNLNYLFLLLWPYFWGNNASINLHVKMQYKNENVSVQGDQGKLKHSSNKVSLAIVSNCFREVKTNVNGYKLFVNNQTGPGIFSRQKCGQNQGVINIVKMLTSLLVKSLCDQLKT